MPPKEKKEILVPYDISRESKQMLPVGEVASRLYGVYKSRYRSEVGQSKKDTSSRKRMALETRLSISAAGQHYATYREAYKQAAAEEARSRGYNLHYPNQDPRSFVRDVPKRLKRRGPRTW
jgi:hypothetical protein